MRINREDVIPVVDEIREIIKAQENIIILPIKQKDKTIYNIYGTKSSFYSTEINNKGEWIGRKFYNNEINDRFLEYIYALGELDNTLYLPVARKNNRWIMWDLDKIENFLKEDLKDIHKSYNKSYFYLLVLRDKYLKELEEYYGGKIKIKKNSNFWSFWKWYLLIGWFFLSIIIGVIFNLNNVEFCYILCFLFLLHIIMMFIGDLYEY